MERKSFNPWGLHCHQAHLTRLCSEYPENKRHRILAIPLTCSPKGGGIERHRGAEVSRGNTHKHGASEGWAGRDRCEGQLEGTSPQTQVLEEISCLQKNN